MRNTITSLTKSTITGSMALALIAGSVFVGTRPVDASGSNILFFDDFQNGIEFKDQDEDAKWFRYVNAQGQPDDPTIAKYKEVDNGLRLKVNTNSVDGNYSNAEISTSVVGDGNSPFLRFGVDTRLEVRMKYDPNMNTSPINPGTALGSAGLLYWNYSTEPGDLEEGDGEGGVNDAFGFSWQESRSSLPGFFALGVVDGQFALVQPLDTLVDMTVFNTYAIERTHTSIKYFINDNQIAELPINQPGAPTLTDEEGLAADIWVDNATHQFQVNGDEIIVTRQFYHLPVAERLTVKYVKITSLD